MSRQLRVIGWKHVNEMIAQMAREFVDDRFDCIYGEPRGGWIVAVLLSHKTGLPVTRYSNQGRVLWVDDIIDSGRTLTLADHGFSGHAALYHRHDLKTDAYRCADFIDEWIVFPWEDLSKAKQDQAEYEAKRAAS